MCISGLEALRLSVANDAALARQLRAIPAPEFIAETIRLAATHGICLEAEELRAAIAAGSAAWLARWLR